MNKKVPILFTIFNRKVVAVEAFQCIKEYQPERLYISADGPRPHKIGEDLLCTETRESILKLIDWPCEVYTLFQKENKGCANGMFEGITWFFEHEEWGVICEDDVILSQDFFKVCEELLPKFNNEEKLMAISAENNVPIESVSNSFIFTNAFYCWGWASWRRAWDKMDMNLTFWPHCSLLSLISAYGFLRGLYYYIKVSAAYRNLDTFNSWATRYYLAVFYHQGLIMSATTNLSCNIGQTVEGAHYESSDDELYRHLEIGKMKFPLSIPSRIVMSKQQRRREQWDFLRLRIHGLKKKILRFIKMK